MEKKHLGIPERLRGEKKTSLQKNEKENRLNQSFIFEVPCKIFLGCMLDVKLSRLGGSVNPMPTSSFG